MLRRKPRSHESGQTLVFALAFLAIFVLLAGAVLAFATVTEGQRAATEKLAAIDSETEGSSQFALADTRGHPCGSVTAGTMRFGTAASPTDTLTYNVNNCTADSSSQNQPGANCELCVLNTTPSTSPVLNIQSGKTVSVQGEADVNGNVSGTLTATGAGAKIGLYGGSCPGCTTPPPTVATSAFMDPLAGKLPPPTAAGPPGTCNSCASMSAGVYSSVSVTTTTFMNSGTYIFTGPVTINGSQGLLTNSDGSNTVTTDSNSAVHTDSDSGGANSGDALQDTGTVTSCSGAVLTDSTKNWIVNEWAGATISAAGKGNKTVSGTVTTNTATTLTITGSGWSCPSNGAAYTVSPITYAANSVTDADSNWATNQFQGDVVTVTLAGGALETGVVASNTKHTVTMTANWTTMPALGNAYVISKIGYTTTTLVDPSKAWTANQWTGAQVTVTLSGGATEKAVVATNTTNTLTITAPWNPATPAAGNSYSLTTLFYTANSLTDAPKAWAAGLWAGSVVTVTLPGGATETGIVSTNSANTLTMSANWGTLPPNGSAYVVSTLGYTSNSLVDTTKAWPTNQWAGSVVSVNLPGGTIESATVASNTATTLTLTAPWTQIPPGGSTYTVSAAVVIYLACPTAGPYWSCAVGGQTGGSITTNGNGEFNVSPPISGPYAGFSLITDPHLTGTVVLIAGNGGSFNGSVYAPSGVINISGGGSSGTGLSVGGRMIVGALIVSGNANSQLHLTGAVTGSPGSCFSYVVHLTGAQASGNSLGGDVQFETGCSSQAPTGIISFDYSRGYP